MSVNTITQFPFADPVPGLAGRLIGAGEGGYDQARQAWNLTIDQRPDAGVLPESAADVAAAVRYARAAVCGSPRRPPATTRARSGTWPARCSSAPSGCATSG